MRSVALKGTFTVGAVKLSPLQATAELRTSPALTHEGVDSGAHRISSKVRDQPMHALGLEILDGVTLLGMALLVSRLLSAGLATIIRTRLCRRPAAYRQ